MKRSFLFFMLFILFWSGKSYTDDSLFDSGIFEGLPGPPGISEKPVIFEPDPDDPDRDGLSNEEEEKNGTDPFDPDTDNDGITDYWEVINGTDPAVPNTFGYLEVIDLETGNKTVPASDENNHKTDEDYLFLPGYYDGIKPGDPEEYKEYDPPEWDIDIDPFPPHWDDISDLNEFPPNNDDVKPDEQGGYNEYVPPDPTYNDLPFPWDKTNDSIDKENFNDLSEKTEGMALNRSGSVINLMPVYTLLLLNDNDNDGLDDDWEMRYFGTLAYGAEDDPDQDNLSNINEYNNRTDPNNPDTDGDGLTDGWEVVNGLNPNSTDSDDDTMSDGWEVAYGLNPLVNDAYDDMDNDGFPNYFEYVSQTDPTDPNSHPSGVVYNFSYDDNGNLSTMQRRE